MEGRSDSGGDEPVEQVVLGCFQLAHLGQQVIAVTTHRFGMALGLVVFLFGQRCLGNQSPQAGLIGLIGEVRKLLVGNGKLTRDGLHAVGNVSKTPFDEGAAHR